jgi:PilZ domain
LEIHFKIRLNFESSRFGEGVKARVRGRKKATAGHGLTMAEKPYIQARRFRVDLAITKFNRQIMEGIYLLDLDHTGAHLETPFLLSLEYPVEFSFMLPGATKEIQVSGRVIWKEQLTVTPGRYHLRVHFYRPRWDLDNLLNNYSYS